MKEITLNVIEALRKDIGKGVVRIGSKIMDELALESGDFVLIKGNKEGAAKVIRDYPGTEHTLGIRIDSNIRYNVGTSLGEKVKVKKIEIKDAKSITIAPSEEIAFSSDPREFFREKMLERAFKKDDRLDINVLGTTLHFFVTNIEPKGVAKFNNDTILKILEKPTSIGEKIAAITYEDIGGLEDEISQIREMVELPLKHPEIFERVGIGPPKGVLLTGPPGTGKTLLAKAVANESNANFYSIAGPEIMSKFYGESEQRLRELFENANKNAPSIIFIDEIDAIAPKRDEVTGEVERRVVAQLLTSMDGLKARGNVVVIAATNRPDSLDPALRRPGRFDREISINVPDTKGRKEILQIHTRGMPLDKDVDLDKLAEITLAYTGADLEALCKEAAMKSLREFLPKMERFEEKIPTNILNEISVKMDHFMEAFRKVEPSAMREVLIRKPNVKWQDIGGLEQAKRLLVEAVEWPLKDPESFKKVGIKPPKGVLLTGPPGTGKTLLAKAVANESEANFISVKGPELISKWVGESEKHVREIFKKARQVAPSIIFFDEFDAISQVRGHTLSDATERVVNQLLTELDGIEELEKVVVIAATNRVDLIDPGLLRPGRIDLIVEIKMPDEKERFEIFKVHTRNMPLAKDIDIMELARITKGHSGADIAGICREAGMELLRELKAGKIKEKQALLINKKHFESALKRIIKAEK